MVIQPQRIVVHRSPLTPSPATRPHCEFKLHGRRCHRPNLHWQCAVAEFAAEFDCEIVDEPHFNPFVAPRIEIECSERQPIEVEGGRPIRDRLSLLRTVTDRLSLRGRTDLALDGHEPRPCLVFDVAPDEPPDSERGAGAGEGPAPATGDDAERGQFGAPVVFPLWLRTDQRSEPYLQGTTPELVAVRATESELYGKYEVVGASRIKFGYRLDEPGAADATLRRPQWGPLEDDEIANTVTVWSELCHGLPAALEGDVVAYQDPPEFNTGGDWRPRRRYQ